MSGTSVVNELKRLLLSLDPSTRGEVVPLTDEVKAQVKALAGDLDTECRQVLGEPLDVVVDKVVPDSARADYAWAARKAKRLLDAGDVSVLPDTSDPQAPVFISNAPGTGAVAPAKDPKGPVTPAVSDDPVIAAGGTTAPGAGVTPPPAN